MTDKICRPSRGALMMRMKKDRPELSHRSSNRPTKTVRSRVEVLLAKSIPGQTGKRTVPSGIPGRPPQAIQLSGRWNSGPGGSRCCCCDSTGYSCSGSPTDNSRPRCSNCRHGSRGSGLISFATPLESRSEPSRGGRSGTSPASIGDEPSLLTRPNRHRKLWHTAARGLSEAADTIHCAADDSSA